MAVVLNRWGFSLHLAHLCLKIRLKVKLKLAGCSEGNIWEHFCSSLEIFPDDPAKLLQLANLPLNSPLWVQIGKPDELAEAELKYVGPLTRGSSAVIFGVRLKVD